MNGIAILHVLKEVNTINILFYRLAADRAQGVTESGGQGGTGIHPDSCGLKHIQSMYT